MDIIDSFDNKYAFLSNFYEIPVEYRGVKYKNSEAAFQHAKLKAMSKDEQLKFIWHLNSGLKSKILHLVDAEDPNPLTRVFRLVNPSVAKRLGRAIPIRDNWEEEKYLVMKEIVRNKFTQNSDLSRMLLGTGDSTLIEGNHWHDNTWGVCRCSKCADKVGSNGSNNNLGKILMKVRDELRK